MPNRLANQTSPYLLQHAGNPVDWWPWCPEALQAAKDRDCPIFLSIGYSACHWCHVMERESFEDQAIAACLNEHFVSIKVDREERPDLDQIYMRAVQLLTRQGGWPLSAFLTPDLRPFYGGTYWPPQPMFNRPGFMQVLHAVLDAWTNRRDQALETAQQLTKHLDSVGAASRSELSHDLSNLALGRLAESFDQQHGGFGHAPKFPHAMDIQLLIRHGMRGDRADSGQFMEMACTTLDKMAQGGIYDHIGGGFARYSTDDQWLVPHFEKMLYDNALLIGAYLDAYLVTGRLTYRHVIEETIEYIFRDMTDPLGGFYSSEDADSDGVEGKYDVWTVEELTAALGESVGAEVAQVYGVTPSGNFEGRNILHLSKTLEATAEEQGRDAKELYSVINKAKTKLRIEREKRIRPAKDDKMLTSWNGFLIDSLARAGAALERADYTQAAAKAAQFVRENLQTPDGRLLHCGRVHHGQLQPSANARAFLEDYGAMIVALTSLYEATWNEAWIDWAADLADQLLAHFYDPDGGGFYFTSDDHETLITRHKDVHDASIPSGNALAATGLIRLGLLCGRNDWLSAAQSTLEMAADTMRKSPMTGQLFAALDLLQSETSEVIAVVRPAAADDITRILRTTFNPRRVTALRIEGAEGHRSSHLDGAFAAKVAGDEANLYICSGHACGAPVSGVASVAAALTTTAFTDGDNLK